MLYPLIFLIISMFLPLNVLANCEQKRRSCEVSSLQGDISKDIQLLEEKSLQKIEDLVKDKDFKDFLTIAENRTQKPENNINSSSEKDSFLQTFPDSTYQAPASCYIFVSFSLGEKALVNLASEAKRWGAILVLRGFKDGSYTKTAKALQKIILKTGQGILIDPELFTLFAVTDVPTFVLSKPVPFLAVERIQTPIHDRIQGHVSIRYVLEVLAKEGDLRSEAQALLKRREMQ